jgi:hypothetical protein
VWALVGEPNEMFGMSIEKMSPIEMKWTASLDREHDQVPNLLVGHRPGGSDRTTRGGCLEAAFAPSSPRPE